MQSIAEVEAICERSMLAQAEAYMNAQDEEPDPLDAYESCAHACACCRQYERGHGPVSESEVPWREWLPQALGCEECDEHEDQEKARTGRWARR